MFMRTILNLTNEKCLAVIVSAVASMALSFVITQPLHACSDLPNICAQNAQHHQNMMDIAATPEQSGDDESDAGYSAGPGGDPMAAAMAAMSDVSQSVGKSAKEIEARKRIQNSRRPMSATIMAGGTIFRTGSVRNLANIALPYTPEAM